MGVTQSLENRIDIGAGTTTALDGYLKGIVTEVGNGSISVKVLSHVSSSGIEYVKDYQESGTWAFKNTGGNVAIHSAGQSAAYGTTSYTGESDWFSNQELDISVSTLGGTTTTSKQSWNTIAERPGTSLFAGREVQDLMKFMWSLLMEKEKLLEMQERFSKNI